MKRYHVSILLVGLAIASTLTMAGCGQQGSRDNTSSSAAPGQVHDHDGHDHEGHDHASHDPGNEPTHGGWWCYEHGVPEEQCAMCDSRIAAQFREKGDWCDDHLRPDSLCFHCHPENAEPFIALYEARYGKRPPQATD